MFLPGQSSILKTGMCFTLKTPKPVRGAGGGGHRLSSLTWKSRGHIQISPGWGVNITGDVYIAIHSLFTKEPQSSLSRVWTHVLSGPALGSGRWARLCCCWSRACSVCCRCCGPHCCSLRPAGRWGLAAFLQSPLRMIKKRGKERHIMSVRS